MCDWCNKLEKLIKDGGKTSGKLMDIKLGSDEWSLLLRASLAIRMDPNAKSLTIATLCDKFGMFKMLFSSLACGGVASQSAASTVASQPTSSSAASSSVAGAPMSEDYTTPQKGRKRIGSSASPRAPAGSSPPSVATKSEPDNASNNAMRRMSTNSEAALPPELADKDDDDDEEDEDDDLADDSMSEVDGDEAIRSCNYIPKLSVEGRFPTKAPGPSLAKMRHTINKHIGTLERQDWMLSLRPGTVKALEKRLAKHQKKVTKLANLTMMEAYTALLARVRAYYKIYRSILAWRNTQEDTAIVQVLQWLRALDPVMTHFGYNYAPDLALFRIRATFMEVFTSQGTVMKVAGGGGSPVTLCHSGLDSPKLGFAIYSRSLGRTCHHGD